jgi:hypothetical protein
MLRPLNFRHTTGALDGLHLSAKQALPAPGLHERLALSFGQVAIFANVEFDATFPLVQGGLELRAEVRSAVQFGSDVRRLIGFAADKADESRSECGVDLRQIHALQTVTVRAER